MKNVGKRISCDKVNLVLFFSLIIMIMLISCQKKWRPGIPLAKNNLKIGVLYISDPFIASAGYDFAHQVGIYDMINDLSLRADQVTYKTNVDYASYDIIENSIRVLIDQGTNIIIATSWGYMDTCEFLAKEFPSVVFAHASGNRFNNSNFTNYFGKHYEARYLSGIIAGLKTESNKIGYVAAWGTENSEVSGGLNAFAMGVEKVNPNARIYVKVTNSWYDPMGETDGAIELINLGCDIITQHVDTVNPQLEAEKAGIWSIGYNTDASVIVPNTALISVLWNWGVYYKYLITSVIEGKFTTTPYLGSLADGVVGLSPLNQNIQWDSEHQRIYAEEMARIKEGNFDIFKGEIKTNDGSFIDLKGEKLSDKEILFGINWYYHNIIRI